MFGLMRPEGGCSHKETSDYHFHRMHYCGVCKSMGKSYSHKTRFLLNYDIVFLAEILSELSAEDLGQWGDAYQAINRCFTMPGTQETPTSIQYATDANLLLSELKIKDHVADTGRFSWRFAGWWFKKAFTKANLQLQKWGLDASQISYWTDIQKSRESIQPDPKMALSDYLWSVAEPTAQLTSMIFRQGAIAVGSPEQAEVMAQLGLQFGYLAYLLDAFEDVEKDAFGHQFNPFLSYFEGERTLTEAEFGQGRTIIDAVQTGIAAILPGLSINSERVELYSSRLASNVAMQIYRDRVIPRTLKERIVHRWQAAKEFARKISCDNSSWTAKLRYHFLSVAVFMAPRTPEFMGLSGKEMVVFTWAAFLSAFLAAIGLGFAVGTGKSKNKKKKRKEKRSIKRFIKKLRHTFSSANNCWEACAAACCAGCCSACCASCSNGCCNSCCEGCSNLRQ